MPDKVLFEFSEQGLKAIADRLATIESELSKSGTKGKQAFTAIKGSVGELNEKLKVLKNTIINGVEKGSAEQKKLIQEYRATKVQIDAMNNSLRTTPTMAKSMGSGMKEAFVGIGAAIAGAMVVYNTFNQLITKSIEAADKQLKAEASLTKALGFRSKALLKQADDLMYLTNAEDEITIKGQAFLAMQKLNEKQILQMTPAIINYAKVTGTDLEQAFKQAGQSIAGGRNIFQRYGITLKGVGDEQSRIDIITKGLTDRFEGQAELLAGTGAGSLEAMKIGYGEIQEEIGKLILANSEYAKGITEGLKKTKEFVSEMGESGTKTERAGAALLLWNAIVTNVKLTIVEFWNVFKGMFITPIDKGIKAIGKIFGVTVNWRNLIEQTRGAILGFGASVSSVFTDLGNWDFSDLIKNAKEAYGKTYDEFIKKEHDKSKEQKEALKEWQGKLAEASRKEIVTHFSKLKTITEQEKQEYIKRYNEQNKYLKLTEKGLDILLEQNGLINKKLTKEEIEKLEKLKKARQDDLKKAGDDLDKYMEDEIKTLEKIYQEEKELQDKRNALIETEKSNRIQWNNQKLMMVQQDHTALQISYKDKKEALLKERKLANEIAEEEIKDKIALEKRKAGIKSEYDAKDKDNEKTHQDEILEIKKAAVEAARETANAIVDIVGERQRWETEQELSELEKRRSHELDNKILTEKQIDAINNKYDAEEEKLKKKQFKRDKRLAILKAFINAASAFVAAWIEPTPLAIAKVIAIAATLAANVAVIAAQKFAEGEVDIKGGQEGKDSIPALLMPHESVIKSKPTLKYKSVLQAINDDRLDEHLTSVYLPKLMAKKNGQDFAENFAQILNNSQVFDDYRLYKEAKKGNKLSEINTEKLIRAINNKNKKRLWSD